MSLRRLLRPAFLAVTIVAWAGSILLLGRVLLNYENTPGQPGTPSRYWPTGSHIYRPAGKYALVMLVHPDCPCSEASLSELERLLAQLHGKLTGFVVFGRPASKEEDVQTTKLWKRASAIPDVTTLYDAGSREIERFRGEVSGYTMLYDPSGRLMFHGGITGARGHEGDNAGRDSVIRLVGGESHEEATSPVFGCSLHDPTSQALREEPAWRK
jgi:hypothetical protein